ncbi:MAG: HlyD family efflux transporter periplasmic adaptor subunit [Bacteroidota bacterium]
MTTRQITITLAILLLVVGAGGFAYLRSQKAPAETKPPTKGVKMVKVRQVENQTIKTDISLTGRLVAKQMIEVFAEVSGLLMPDNNRFKEGNYYKKGQALIQIDDREHQMNLLAQKSSLMNQITLMLPDLKTDYPESFPNWEGYLKEMDIKETLRELPEPVSDQERYFVSAKNIYNLYYTIQSLETRSDKYQIQAPFNGVVTEANIFEGTLVRSGQKLGEFINPYVYELEAAVDVNDISFFKIGDQVILTSNDMVGEWKGRVSRISDRIDPNTQTLRVFITTSGKQLKEGMYLNASVQGNIVKDALEISRALLINNDQVYVVQDSLLKLQQVEPVFMGAKSAIVKGLEGGTTLVDESVVGAYEGLKVGPYREGESTESTPETEEIAETI